MLLFFFSTDFVNNSESSQLNLHQEPNSGEPNWECLTRKDFHSSLPDNLSQSTHHQSWRDEDEDEQCNNLNDNKWFSCIDIRNYEPFESTKPTPAEENRMEWEKGNPDYMGANAFDNIIAKLNYAVTDHYGQTPDHLQSQTEESQMGESHMEESYIAESQTVTMSIDEGTDYPETETETENQVTDIEDEATEKDVEELPIDDRQSWEVGNPDYMGKASFELILKRIEANVEPSPKTESKSITNGKVTELTPEEATISENETLTVPITSEKKVLHSTSTQTILSTLSPYYANEGGKTQSRRVMWAQKKVVVIMYHSLYYLYYQGRGILWLQPFHFCS